MRCRVFLRICRFNQQIKDIEQNGLYPVGNQEFLAMRETSQVSELSKEESHRALLWHLLLWACLKKFGSTGTDVE